MTTLKDIEDIKKLDRIMRGEYTWREWFTDWTMYILSIFFKAFLWSIVPICIAYYFWK